MDNCLKIKHESWKICHVVSADNFIPKTKYKNCLTAFHIWFSSNNGGKLKTESAWISFFTWALSGVLAAHRNQLSDC